MRMNRSTTFLSLSFIDLVLRVQSTDLTLRFTSEQMGFLDKGNEQVLQVSLGESWHRCYSFAQVNLRKANGTQGGRLITTRSRYPLSINQSLATLASNTIANRELGPTRAII